MATPLSRHPLKSLVENQKRGLPEGITSVCSANEYVLLATLERSLEKNLPVLIEATANQVNQYGGYTGMKPADFRNFVEGLAKQAGFPLGRLILGGDHLGPLTWKDCDETSAMSESKELIRQYVAAGFTKIHLDTSMHLASDDKKRKLATTVVARRGAELAAVAEETFRELLKTSPKALHPVYVIGSEVPIPGGAQEEEDGLQVTKVPDFLDTVETYRQVFEGAGLAEAWGQVVAVVVQPGVEFGDETIHEYDRSAARSLTKSLAKFPSLVFEGHSTDYQTPEGLRRLVEDGVGILKVGPALTFALREGLYALSMIEAELYRYQPEVQLSNFVQVLDDAMARRPKNWRNHYRGTPAKIRFARKFSFSDRARYDLPDPEVREATALLLENLSRETIPLSLLSQYMPLQYQQVRQRRLKNEPVALLKDRVVNCLDEYFQAVIPSNVTLPT